MNSTPKGNCERGTLMATLSFYLVVWTLAIFATVAACRIPFVGDIVLVFLWGGVGFVEGVYEHRRAQAHVIEEVAPEANGENVSWTVEIETRPAARETA